MQRRKILRGQDGYGVVHFDSEAKQMYIWPLCSTPHLDIQRLHSGGAPTCLRCVVVANSIDWWDWR